MCINLAFPSIRSLLLAEVTKRGTFDVDRLDWETFCQESGPHGFNVNIGSKSLNDKLLIVHERLPEVTQSTCLAYTVATATSARVIRLSGGNDAPLSAIPAPSVLTMLP